MPDASAELKVCSRCRSEKPRSEFFNSKTSSDGKGSWCKSCQREAVANAQRKAARCTVEGCQRKQKARGLCDTHLARRYAHGTTADPDLLIVTSDGARAKLCAKCRQVKPVSEFYRKARAKSYETIAGYSGRCKGCTRADHNAYVAREPERWNAVSRELRYRKSFGIGLDDYNAMFAEQGGRCAICGTHQSEFTKALAVDHDHATGVVRGLLCVNCNSALGKLRDSTHILMSAIQYIEAHRLPTPADSGDIPRTGGSDQRVIDLPPSPDRLRTN